MLALIQRRRGKVLAARVCAETAYRLAPSDAQVRLVRAEVLLCTPDDRRAPAPSCWRSCPAAERWARAPARSSSRSG